MVSADVARARAASVAGARSIAATVADPELPMLSLAELGILRDVRVESGRVIVTIAPTYSGCPALSAIRADLVRALRGGGYLDVAVHTQLDPPWTTDWITPDGRRKLAEHGIAPPGPAPHRPPGPVALTLGPLGGGANVACPQCGSSDTVEVSAFGSTACKALWRCLACAEPFERIKEL